VIPRHPTGLVSRHRYIADGRVCRSVRLRRARTEAGYKITPAQPRCAISSPTRRTKMLFLNSPSNCSDGRPDLIRAAELPALASVASTAVRRSSIARIESTSTSIGTPDPTLFSSSSRRRTTALGRPAPVSTSHGGGYSPKKPYAMTGWAASAYCGGSKISSLDGNDQDAVDHRCPRISQRAANGGSEQRPGLAAWPEMNKALKERTIRWLAGGINAIPGEFHLLGSLAREDSRGTSKRHPGNTHFAGWRGIYKEEDETKSLRKIFEEKKGRDRN